MDERVENFIIERNWWVSGGTFTRALSLWARMGTVRNNIFDLSNANPGSQNWAIAIFRLGVEPPPDDIQVYNNTAYSSFAQFNVGIDFTMITVDPSGAGATNIIVRDNYASAPGYVTKSVLFDPFNRTTNSNNTITNTPGWVSATPSVPAHFKPAAGSAAIGTGTVVPVWSDFFRESESALRDIGAVSH
jgi:hypothetical protein